MHLNGGGGGIGVSFNGSKLARNEPMDKRFMLMIIFRPRGLSVPAPGLYTVI